MYQNKLKYGIVQGRLTQSPNGQLQWFPQGQWESEFYIANAIGLKYIELIAERNHNPKNPIWDDAGIEKIKNLSVQNSLECYSICNDYLIDNGILGIEQEKVLKQLHLFTDRAVLLNMQLLILPLFEESELNKDNFNDFIPIIKDFAEYVKGKDITICLETILDGKNLSDFIDAVESPNVKCVFDTGNRIAYGHSIYSDIILLGDKVGHVHIKDKNSDDCNVLLGNGLVNFFEVFKALSEIKYSGSHTFETNRGKNPIKTANFNMNFCDYCYFEK